MVRTNDEVLKTSDDCVHDYWLNFLFSLVHAKPFIHFLFDFPSILNVYLSCIMKTLLNVYCMHDDTELCLSGPSALSTTLLFTYLRQVGTSAQVHIHCIHGSKWPDAIIYMIKGSVCCSSLCSSLRKHQTAVSICSVEQCGNTNSKREQNTTVTTHMLWTLQLIFLMQRIYVCYTVCMKPWDNFKL